MTRPTQGIATDAAHSSKNGLTQFRAVDIATGTELFRESLGNRTVNIGEFLGVVTAIKYIIANNFVPKIIYTDSATAISWFNERRTASKKHYPELQKAEVYLKAMQEYISDIKVVHWNNSVWGEIPADFGNK